MMPDAFVFLIGFIYFAFNIPVFYRIYIKKYGKQSVVVSGKIIAFFEGSGLKKTYTPMVEYTVSGTTYKCMARDNISIRNKYVLYEKVELYYNETFNKIPVLIKNDNWYLMYSIFISAMGLVIMLLVVIDAVKNGGLGYTKVHPWAYILELSKYI